MVTVLVPLGGRCPHRAAAWDWVRPRYAGFEVIVSECRGPWSKSAAVMDGAPKCSETIVIADSDSWTDGVFDAIERVEHGASWAMGHEMVHRLTPAATAEVLAGEEPEGLSLIQPAYRGIKGGGVVVVSRDVLLDVPWDSRFVGWGRADRSWRDAMTTLHGDPWRGSSPLFHLWHPPMERLGQTRSLSTESETLYARYEKARGDASKIRELLREAECAV